MSLGASVEAALAKLCFGARACGIGPDALACALLCAAAKYARSAGWSLTRARAELGEQWLEDETPGARATVPGGVAATYRGGSDK
jgi:hypothetical protein